MTRLPFAAVAVLAAIVAMSGPVQAELLSVGAPPSLRAALEEIVPLFEQEYRARVSVAYTASKMLLRQIEHGAPIDVFVSAGLEEVEYLHRHGLTLNGPPRILARTSVVLVMLSNTPAALVSMHDAFADHTVRIALGDPQLSYLGEVTARALSKVYPAYKSRTPLLYAPHTEDILNLIRQGKADVGLVYRANVINSGEVVISDEMPLGSVVQIEFGQAVVSTCRASSRAVAEQFSDFLMTPRIMRLLEKYGFQAPLLPAAQPARSRSQFPSPRR